MSKEVVENCPVRQALMVIGGKWNLLILVKLEKTRRFGEIKKAIPDISEKVLIEKLRLLTEYKLVNRKNFNEIPPKVEYSLTGLGKEITKLTPNFIEIGNKLLKKPLNNNTLDKFLTE